MKKKYLPYSLILICSVILAIRAFYGFCWSDETFYSSTAYRFLCGDRLFIDDWFPTQLSGVVILPFIAVYKAFCGSMDGVILFLRLAYVIASFVVSAVVFYVFDKNKNEMVAYGASIMTLFYTHLNIATLSYYTISFQCFLISVLLIYHYTSFQRKWLLIVSGVLFAISVLALPTMAVAYVLFMIILTVFLTVSGRGHNIKIKDMINRLNIKRMMLYSFIGIIIPAVIFFIFLLLNVSISDFIKGIPYVLSDEEHGTSLIFPIRKFFISLNEIYRKWAYLGYLLIIGCIFFKKLIYKLRLRYLVFIADVILFVIYGVKSFNHTGYIQSALCICSLVAYILTAKRDRRLFHTVYLGGLLFSLVYSYSSNGFLYVLSIGHTIAAIAGISFIYDFCLEIRKEGKIARMAGYIAFAMVMYVLITTAYLRIVNVYRDAPLNQLKAKITTGPAKGLYTTSKHLEMYNEVTDFIEKECNRASLGINDNEEGYLLITKLLPFGYMCTDLRVAAPSTWRNSFNSDRLREYYELNPQKAPDMILLLNKEYGTYDTCGDTEYDPSPNDNEMGGFLEEYIRQNGLKEQKVSCGILYKK